MKKYFAWFLALCLISGMTGCASSAPQTSSASSSQSSSVPSSQSSAASKEQGSTELTVFAAASLTETLTKIGDSYMQKNPGVKLTFSFDSSGTLKKQIQEGAECDVFLSAAQKQMDQLDLSADPKVNTEKLDFIDHGTRVNLLENKVALAVPSGNPKNIKSYQDLKAALEKGGILLAMGNSDVPVGQYTQKILKYLGLDEKKLAAAGLLSYGSNVKEVTSQVTEAAADCGIIYATDAFSAKLTVVDTATSEMCGQVIYPGAVLKKSKNPEAAKAFLEALRTPEATAVFEAVGFSAVK